MSNSIGTSVGSPLPSALISVRGATKAYPMGSNRLEVLRGIDVDIAKGEAVCIVGSSGAGKSTLLHVMGTLDKPTLGKVFFKGVDLTRESDEKLAEFRNRSMGFVFQFHHLMAEFTALENVMMPCRIGGLGTSESRERAARLLEVMGLSSRAAHYPSELSGGEQQRVAIARSLVREPEVLFADEPTGNLDTVNAAKIQDLFFDLKAKLNLTLVVVTHDLAFAQKFPKVLKMRDGLWA